ncbi:MAG: TetR family transcriptional regulator C-terminal domain-containing protein [Pseudomonadota bacterium]|nr:TetR family transcriptional regulator C-terminal domain-containing protein [Pseudomonadota bacterium]
MTTAQDAPRRGPKPNPRTRDNLVRAGLAGFHERGFNATGIKEIVDAASVPKGSFYNHFDGKEAFAAEVVDLYFGRGLADMSALLNDASLPPMDRLRAYFERRTESFVAAGFKGGCLMGNLSLEIADHSPAIRERLAAHFRTWAGLFETCIAEAQASGAIATTTPPAVLAAFLLNSWEGALLRMRVEKSDAPLKDFARVVFGSLLV